jgi:hypothetical protein
MKLAGKISILLFTLLATCSGKASYTPYQLPQMIFKAEQIVYGEIIAIDSLTYHLKVEKSVLDPLDTIEVRRFRNWACAWRWADYKVGQRVFLFLDKYNGIYHALSAGNEGELPVYHDSVYVGVKCFGRVTTFFDQFEKRKFYNDAGYLARVNKLYGAEYKGFKTNLDVFFYSMKVLRKCFTVSFSKAHYSGVAITQVQQNCPQHKIDYAIRTSPVFKWVCNQLREKSS